VRLIIGIVTAFVVAIFGTFTYFKWKREKDLKIAENNFNIVKQEIVDSGEPVETEEFLKSTVREGKPLLQQPNIQKYLKGEYDFSLTDLRRFSNISGFTDDIAVWKRHYQGTDKDTISNESLADKVYSAFGRWDGALKELQEDIDGENKAGRLGVDLLRKMDPKVKSEHYAKLLALMEHYEKYGRIRIMAGRATDAVIEAEVLYNLTSMIGREAGMVGEWRVYIRANRIFCRLVRKIVESQKAAPRDLQLLQKLLQRSSPASILPQYIRARRITAYEGIDRELQGLLETENESLNPTGDDFALMPVDRFRILSAYFTATQLLLNDDGQKKKRVVQADFKVVDDYMKEVIIKYKFDEVAQKVITESISKMKSTSLNVLSAQVERDITALGIASELYRQKNNRWPKELGELPGEFISKKLVNPATGKDYGYAIDKKEPFPVISGSVGKTKLKWQKPEFNFLKEK